MHGQSIVLAFTFVQNFIRNFKCIYFFYVHLNHWYRIATLLKYKFELSPRLKLELFLKQLSIHYMNRKTYLIKGISQGSQNASRIGCEVHVFNILTFSFPTRKFIIALILFKLYYFKPHEMFLSLYMNFIHELQKHYGS